MASTLQKISPCLFFSTQAEEAAKFFVSLFEDSRIDNVMYYDEGHPFPDAPVCLQKYCVLLQRHSSPS